MAKETWTTLVRAVMTRRDHMATEAARFDLTLAQAHLLGLLQHGPARTMTAIANALACDASNVTGIVDRLEARRLIVRRPADHDRRVKTISLTPEGAALMTDLSARMLKPPAGFDRLTPTDLASLHALVHRVIGEVCPAQSQPAARAASSRPAPQSPAATSSRTMP